MSLALEEKARKTKNKRSGLYSLSFSCAMSGSGFGLILASRVMGGGKNQEGGAILGLFRADEVSS